MYFGENQKRFLKKKQKLATGIIRICATARTESCLPMTPDTSMNRLEWVEALAHVQTTPRPHDRPLSVRPAALMIQSVCLFCKSSSLLGRCSSETQLNARPAHQGSEFLTGLRYLWDLRWNQILNLAPDSPWEDREIQKACVCVCVCGSVLEPTPLVTPGGNILYERTCACS